jgi:hypothetical protein
MMSSSVLVIFVAVHFSSLSASFSLPQVLELAVRDRQRKRERE